MRRDSGLTVIVISHDLSGLDELFPCTVHLHAGRLATPPPARGRVV